MPPSLTPVFPLVLAVSFVPAGTVKASARTLHAEGGQQAVTRRLERRTRTMMKIRSGLRSALLVLLLPATAQAAAEVRGPLPAGGLALLASEEPAFSCVAIRERAAAVFVELDSEIVPDIRAMVIETLDTAAAWDSLAGAAYLVGGAPVALWAELNLLQRHWQSAHLSHAGIYLVKLGRIADAKLFLGCAYAMGYRSPYLFEALAVTYLADGDRREAAQQIRTAQEMAPDDALIQAEVSLIEVGKLPMPPEHDEDDPVGRAMRELERHLAATSAQLKQHEDLSNRLRRTVGGNTSDWTREGSGSERQARWQAHLDSIEPMLDDARMPLDQIKKRYGDLSDVHAREIRENLRGAVLMSIFSAYSAATMEVMQFGRVLEIYHGYDLLLWSEVLGLDPFALAREIRTIETAEQRGLILGNLAHYTTVSESLQAPELTALGPPSRALLETNVEARRACGLRFRGGSQIREEEACKLEADVAWCAGVMPLYERWANYGRERYEHAARAFDAVAAKRLEWGALQAADARDFAARTLEDFDLVSDSDVIDGMNQAYDRLARLVLSAEEPGPARGLQQAAEWFARDRERAQQDLESAAVELTRICSEVQRIQLDRLAEERAEAMREVLRDKLIADLNMRYDPTGSCSVGIGVASLTINDAGAVSISGAKELLERVIGDRDNEKGGLGIGVEGSYKAGESFGGSVSGGAGGNYGPFNGKGDVALATTYDLKNDTFKTTAQIKGSLGLGFKRGDVGVACYPGEFSASFEPRAVMDSAAVYLGH